MFKVIFVDADDFFFYNELSQLYNILLNFDFLEISIIHLCTCTCLNFLFNLKICVILIANTTLFVAWGGLHTIMALK